jgi:hypothetical protein
MLGAPTACSASTERRDTIASRDGRGLAGHSMGGYGTLRVGMKQPGAFAAMYAMSSCCLMNDPAAGRGAGPARGDAARGDATPGRSRSPAGREAGAGRGAAPGRGVGGCGSGLGTRYARRSDCEGGGPKSLCPRDGRFRINSKSASYKCHSRGRAEIRDSLRVPDCARREQTIEFEL